MAEAPIRLAGVHEVTEVLGIDPEIVADLPASEALVRAGTPFPRPIAELIDHGPIWSRGDVEAWKAARREAWSRTPAGRSL